MIDYYMIDHPYKGKRLFKHDTWNNTVVQVVVNSGEKKKGRPNMKGIYRISENTLKGNYLWKIHERQGLPIKRTTKKLFEYYAHKTLREILKDSENGRLL